MVNTASMIPIIQNLTTIFASGNALTGFVIRASMPSFWKWWCNGVILNTLRPVPRECGPVTFSDGNVRVSAGFRLFASTYLWYGRKGVFCDGGRGVVEFGDRCDAEIFFRVAGNLVVGLCGDKICCVILSGLIIRPDGQ